MPPKRNVQVDLSGQSIDIQLAKILNEYFKDVGATAKARAQQIIGEEIKDRSGKLKSKVDFEIRFPGGGKPPFLEFYNDAGQYAVYQHEGTGIYGPEKRPIRPVKAKLLTWVDPDTGQRVWAKEVRGTPGKKFIERAINFALNQVNNRR